MNEPHSPRPSNYNNSLADTADQDISRPDNVLPDENIHDNNRNDDMQIDSIGNNERQPLLLQDNDNVRAGQDFGARSENSVTLSEAGSANLILQISEGTFLHGKGS